jgi:hypothetical protein
LHLGKNSTRQYIQGEDEAANRAKIAQKFGKPGTELFGAKSSIAVNNKAALTYISLGLTLRPVLQFSRITRAVYKWPPPEGEDRSYE